jgi:hypothetical protein
MKIRINFVPFKSETDFILQRKTQDVSLIVIEKDYLNHFN